MTVIEIAVRDLKLAPARFQYKAGADTQTGAGLALNDCRFFDLGLSGVITTWYSPDGFLFVVNGHQRVELAKRLGYDGPLRCQVLDSGTSHPNAILRGVDAAYARTYGALINISEGRGDALDAAKLMRDTKMSDVEMSKRGISLTDKLMAQAVPLSQLDEAVFRAAIFGRIEVSTAVLIGRELADDREAQLEIFRLTQQDGRNPHHMEYLTDSRLLELIRLGKSAGTVETQGGLFGPSKESLLHQKAELLERVKKHLRSHVHVFGTAVRYSEMLKKGNTVVDRETGDRISTSSAALLDVLNRTAYLVGTAASEILNKYAKVLAPVALVEYGERRKIAADCTSAIIEAVGPEAESLVAA
jgi:hypothetical protein